MLQEAFAKLKGNLELSPSYQAQISTHHKAVRSVIEAKGSNITSRLIGSLQRNTRIPPRDGDIFDIDILVELGEFNRWPPGGITARDAMATLGSYVGQSERYGSMSPYADAPTICFHYKDNVKVELVPAYRDKIGFSFDGTPCPPAGRGYWIPSGNGSWKHADYDHDAEQITEMNRLSLDYLVPTIKMLKAVKRQFFPGMSSFHLEVLAWHCVPSAVLASLKSKTAVTFPLLIADFFLSAQNLLPSPLQLSGSNSLPVSLEVNELPQTTTTFATLSKYSSSLMNLPTETQQLNGWRQLFGDMLPMS